MNLLDFALDWRNGWGFAPNYRMAYVIKCVRIRKLHITQVPNISSEPADTRCDKMVGGVGV